MDAVPRATSLGKGSGSKMYSLMEKLSAGETASEGDVQQILDELLEPEAMGGESHAQVIALESLSLLCGAGAGGRLVDSIVGGDSLLQRLTLLLQQELHAHKKDVGSSPELTRSALQLVSRLPDEALCRLFSTREATSCLHGYVTDHPDESLRAFAISRLASACTRCWVFFDRRAFINGGFEEGADAQRLRQRARDWIYDFLASLVRLCDDPSDAVAAAAFVAVGATLKRHPLCTTAVDEGIRSFWGFEKEPERRDGEGKDAHPRATHKQVFSMQHLGEVLLRSALPRIRQLFRRQLHAGRTYSPPAIDTCALLLVAALRLTTGPEGTPIKNPLLEPPPTLNFLSGEAPVGKATRTSIEDGGGLSEGDHAAHARAKSTVGAVDNDDVSGPFVPKELAQKWVALRLRVMLEEDDPLLVEAAAWATLRVLQLATMETLRASTAPRVAEAFLRLTPTSGRQPFHAGQQEALAGAAIALGLSPPSAIAAIAPHLLAATEGVPEARQRLTLLTDAFFLLLVRPARRTSRSGRTGSRAARTSSQSLGDDSGRVGREEMGAGGKGELGNGWESPLSVLLAEKWFAALVSDAPRRLRHPVFREEAVAALATTCSQVLTAGVVGLGYPASHKRGVAAAGIGTAFRSKGVLPTDDLASALGVQTAPPPADATAAAAAAKKRRVDLEMWLACSLMTLEMCTRCVTWKSTTGEGGGGNMAGLAYVRLLSVVLHLLSPSLGSGLISGDSVNPSPGVGTREFDTVVGGFGGLMLDEGEGEMGPSLTWARERLAQVVDDLMWKLREGLPGRDVRLLLLQATCTHVRLLSVVSGDGKVIEEASMELVAVLQVELGGFDAQAGITTQPQRPAALTAGGSADYNGTYGIGYSGGVGGLGTPSSRGGERRSPSLSHVNANTSMYASGGGSASPINDSAAAQGMGSVGVGQQSLNVSQAGGGGEEDVSPQPPVREGGTHQGGLGGLGGGAAASGANDRGSMSDVMAHELVVGCLVRLALGAGGETAVEVLNVLGHERGRARARERLGRNAVGPMEEAVSKGIRIVELLMVERRSTAARESSASGAAEEFVRPRELPATVYGFGGRLGTGDPQGERLLRRFLVMMELGWQAWVQPDERVLLGARASVFDHGAHGLLEIHRRLRRNLCGLDGDTRRVTLGAWDFPRHIDGDSMRASGGDISATDAFFQAHQWEEEAPQAQLNGGGDPVIVTVTHTVCHERGEAFLRDDGGDVWGGGSAAGPRPETVGLIKAARSGMLGAQYPEGNLGNATFLLGDSGGQRRSGGVMLRVRAYNATNARLHGFVIKLGFGQGVDLEGIDSGGRVEVSVDEVLMPGAAHTLEVPLSPVNGLQDVVVHVSLTFPDAEPEPEFDLEGTTELLGMEDSGEGGSISTGGSSGNARGGSSSFGGGPDDEFGGARGMDGEDEGTGGFVQASIHAGSYRIPQEDFLRPPARANARMVTSWLGFQTAWSGLPYIHTSTVETCPAHGEDADILRTARGVRSAMSAPRFGGRGGGEWARGGRDTRAAATVECPGGNTDYALSVAWAFEAWDGTPLLCALTAMKAPFSRGQGHSNGKVRQAWSWCGRMEVRCGSPGCAQFVVARTARLTRFVTNGVFAHVSSQQQWQQQEQQSHQVGTEILASANGSGAARTNDFLRTELNIPISSRTSKSSIPPSSRWGDVGHAQVAPLVRTLNQVGCVDTA